MSITYAKYFQKWVETYKESKVREVTMQRYLIYMKRVEESKLGKMDIKKIKRNDIQEYFNNYGKTRMKKTVLDHHTLIKSSFVDAAADGYIRSNPCVRIDITSKEDNWSIAERIKRRNEKKWLEIDEYRKVRMYLIGLLSRSFQQSPGEELEAKNIKGEPVYSFKPRTGLHQMSLMIIYTALKTGARFSEVVGLTKDNINFKDMTVNIEKTYDYKYLKGFVETKNISSIREILVDAEYMAVMKSYFNWLEKHEVELESGAIFIKKGIRIHASTTSKILKGLLEAVDVEHITFHQLRHTHASILIAEGVSLQVIAKRLGHTDTSMIQRVYGHLLESTEVEENKKLLELI